MSKMRENTSAFAIGEPCAQNKDGELLWDFETIAKAVSDAIFAEREACATVCREGATKCEHEAQEASANGEQDESVSLRATAWQLTVCANRIEARNQK